MVSWILLFLGLLAAVCFTRLVPPFSAYLPSLFLLVLKRSLSRRCCNTACHSCPTFFQSPGPGQTYLLSKPTLSCGCLSLTPHRASATVTNNGQVLRITQIQIKDATKEDMYNQVLRIGFVSLSLGRGGND